MLNSGSKVLGGNDATNVIRGTAAVDNPALLRDLQKMFNFDYYNPPLTIPFETYLAMLDYIRQALFFDKSIDEGYEELGYAVVQSFIQGTVGRVNKIAAKVMGPEHTPDLLVRVLSGGQRFGRYEVEEVKKGYARFHFYLDPSPPSYLRGMVLSAMHVSEAKNVNVISQIIGREESIHEARWE